MSKLFIKEQSLSYIFIAKNVYDIKIIDIKKLAKSATRNIMIIMFIPPSTKSQRGAWFRQAIMQEYMELDHTESGNKNTMIKHRTSDNRQKRRVILPNYVGILRANCVYIQTHVFSFFRQQLSIFVCIAKN